MLWIHIPLIIYNTKFRVVDRTISSQSVASLVAVIGLKHQQASPVWSTLVTNGTDDTLDLSHVCHIISETCGNVLGY